MYGGTDKKDGGGEWIESHAEPLGWRGYISFIMDVAKCEQTHTHDPAQIENSIKQLFKTIESQILAKWSKLINQN